MTKIYIGNLNYDTTAETLKAMFEEYGTVDSVDIPVFRESGKTRGFAFVKMPDNDAAEMAISSLDGTELDGRTLHVNLFVPKQNENRCWRGGHRFDKRGFKDGKRLHGNGGRGGFGRRDNSGDGSWHQPRW